MIDEGLLDRRVRIERENLVDNGKGGRTRPVGEDAWLLVATVWGQCIPLRGSEAMSNLIQNATQLWKVTIRARRGIDTTMRLRWSDAIIGDVEGNIRSVVPNEERDGIIMTVESGKV